MCGFVGRYVKDRSQIVPPAINDALDLLKHRGPDSSGQFNFDLEPGFLQFGFRRLSIIDLSSSANQPFLSNNQRFIMVFNGEIYNYLELKNELILKGYQFRSNSDTEVLLSAWEEWGIDAVNKFIGMFSIVIYDKLKSEIWCVRDAYGIKPLFYSYSKYEFNFASEINALLKLSKATPKMNQKTAMSYVVSGEYDRSVETFFDGVSQLAPGHFFKVDLHEKEIAIQSKRWWFPKVSENKSLSFIDAAETLREQFLESIKIHLRSDVRIATALSGGLDSSAIVSAIRKIEPELEIHTFSYVADDPAINESKWINLVNSKTNSIPHLVEITPNDFYADLDDLIRSQGEPFGSTSLYAQFRIYESAKASGVTVMLDGQGADELLAGYFGYPENRVQSLLDKHNYSSAFSLISNWSKLPGRESKNLIKSAAKYLLPKSSQELTSRYLRALSKPIFIKDEYMPLDSFSDVYPGDIWSGRRLTQRLLKEQSNGALVSLLRHADRNSMRWSIESRVPFLNTKLSELVLSFPETHLLSANGNTKSVFREAMRGIVNQEVLDRKDKIGFATPQSKWITKDFLSEQLLSERRNEIDFIDQDLLKTFLLSDQNNSVGKLNLTWRIVNLIKWKNLMGIQQ
jgi:asparagine synthase (glutamine-hydrolysing)